VTITKPFYMGIHEVTQEQFEQVTGKNPSAYKEGKTHPVNNIFNIQRAGLPIDTFCEKVLAKTGVTVSLPTEAQWEHACLAGTQTPSFWWDDPAAGSTFGNFKDPNDGFETTAPVGSFKPNPWGLYDMFGNVTEWLSDRPTPNYFGAPTVDPAWPAYSFPLGWNHEGYYLYKWSCFHYPWPHASHAMFGSGHTGHGLSPFAIQHFGFRVVAPVKPTGTPTREAKAKNPPTAAAPVPAAAGPADPTVRVPPGCRAAAGAMAEPYTKSGWAQAIVHEATGMEMVYIPAGTFIRGFNLQNPTDEERGVATYLNPFTGGQLAVPVRVTLSKGFYMGKHEVTQAQWEKVMGKNPSHFKQAGPQAPVEMVSWDDCQAFCEKAGGGLRLPTEAEWEYACRAGTKGLYAGDIDDMGWYLENSDGITHPVGTKKPNAWGLHDMHGNVWEWCQDWFDNFEGPNDKTDPTGPAKENNYHARVIRGGGWGDFRTSCISGIREGFSVRGIPASAVFAVGCRFVMPAASAP
jgi:formylglycine-generating enzyme required for sulfatase activity